MNTEEMNSHLSYLLTELKNSVQRERILIKALQKISCDNLVTDSAAIADEALFDVLKYF